MNTHTHIMCDLETLGRRPGCKILSIGAVVFTQEGLGSTFYAEIQREGQGALHEDPDTLAWWASQSEAARKVLEPSASRNLLSVALSEFNNWVCTQATTDNSGKADAAVWGNGADFDNAILNVAYAEVGLAPCWPFWNARCYRTLKALAPRTKLVRQGTYHNALDDAKTQAVHAIELFKVLKCGFPS